MQGKQKREKGRRENRKGKKIAGNQKREKVIGKKVKAKRLQGKQKREKGTINSRGITVENKK